MELCTTELVSKAPAQLCPEDILSSSINFLRENINLEDQSPVAVRDDHNQQVTKMLQREIHIFLG